MNRIVECDVDGVLLDIYTPVEEALKRQGIEFSFKDSVKTWGMKEIGPLRNTIIPMLLDAELRSQAQWMTGAKDFVKQLSDLCEQLGYTLVLNTHERYYATAKVKLSLLQELAAETEVNFEINVQCGYVKEMLKSYICIDDSLDNIVRSKSKNPLLFNSFHNTELYNGYRCNIHRVDGYSGVLRAITDIQKGVLQYSVLAV